jgi:hypothetical protein
VATDAGHPDTKRTRTPEQTMDRLKAREESRKVWALIVWRKVMNVVINHRTIDERQRGLVKAETYHSRSFSFLLPLKMQL